MTSTRSAAATGLPSQRRDFLASLALLPLVGAGPHTLLANSDSGLLQIAREWDIAIRQYEAAIEANNNACEKLEVVHPSEVMYRQDSDFKYFYGFTGDNTYDLQRYWYGSKKSLSSLTRNLAATEAELATIDEHRLPIFQERISRIREILDANDAWAAEQARREAACGLTSAEAEEERISAELGRLAKAACATKATSLEGATVKARIALWLISSDTDFADVQEIIDEQQDREVFPESRGIALSTCLDLLRIGSSQTKEA